MFCNICHKEEAVVHIKESIGDGKVKTFHLCPKCAAAKGFKNESMLLDISSLAANIAADLLPQPPEKDADDFQIVDKQMPDYRKCFNCGLTVKDFRHSGRLGCASCYTAFEKLLKPGLEAMHRGMVHRGHKPEMTDSCPETNAEITPWLDDLREQLDRAIATESYEQAARIRDQIEMLNPKKT